MDAVSCRDSIMLLNTRLKGGRINAEVTTEVASQFGDHRPTHPPTTNDQVIYEKING